MSDGMTQAKTQEKAEPKRKRRRWKGSHKQVSMPVAMRTVGLDEVEVAYQLDQVVTDAVESENEKLLFDILRECAKLLDAYPAGEEVAPVVPQIIMDIPRPLRETITPGNPEVHEPLKTVN
jgi:hypothetical protein